jgi:small-conductance mechanosensitive channel/CRP-like cAMP-binding protein
MCAMLDLALVLSTVLIALAVRMPALHRLRDLTAPLLLTAAAALGHLLATSLEIDPVFGSVAEVVLVLALGFLVARGCLLVIFDWVLVRRMGISPPRLVREVVALVVYLVLGAILLRSLGVEVTGLIATSAVLTVVVGLALQQTLGNLLAGLALAWEQQLTIGTWIEIDGRVGVIEQTGWRSLLIRTRLDEKLLVPNSEVGGVTIKILGSGAWPAAVAVRFGVAYGVAPDAVKELITAVVTDIPGVLANPAPRVLTVEYADSAVVYECRMWTLSPWRREDLNDQLLTRAHQALARAGMEIPFPQRTLHLAPQPPSSDTETRRLDAISGSALFGGLPREALAAMAGCSRILRFAPGEAVVRVGDRSTALYLIATGEAAIEINGRVAAQVEAGEVFGEVAFLTGDRRTATVRAVNAAIEVVELDESSLRSLLEHHPELADQLAEKMAARQRFDETLRDASGAVVSPAGMVAQLKRQLLRFVGR